MDVDCLKSKDYNQEAIINFRFYFSILSLIIRPD